MMRSAPLDLLGVLQVMSENSLMAGEPIRELDLI